MEETLFPRGKAKYEPTTQSKKRSGTHQDKVNESLFSEGNQSNETGDYKKSKTQSSEQDNILKSHGIKDVDQFMDEQETVNVDFLHCKKVQDSTLLLGCIREIQELQLIVSVPHCNTGYVQANQISEVYTSKIRKHLEMESEKLPPLSDMFHIGDLVICSVLSPTGTATLQLTLMSSVINKYISTSDFFIGQMISGAVKSKEDHGYTIDIGKNNIKAFIPLSEIEDGVSLFEGSVIRCVVSNVRGDGSILLLSLDSKKIAKATVKRDQHLSLDDLQPGMIGMFHPLKKMKAGTVGKFLGYNASICALDCDMSDIHLEDEDFEANFGKKTKRPKKKDFKKSDDGILPKMNKKNRADKRVKGCVLFVNPLTKHVVLSASPFLLNKEVRQELLTSNESTYPRGQKCVATITQCIRGLGAIFKLDDKNETLAFAPTKHLSDEKLNDFTETFNKGNSYPARVLQNLTLDGAVVLSLKKSIVESEFLSYDNIIPGSRIDCVISSVQDNGLLVTLGKKAFSPIKGFVSKIHMSDVVMHHPEKMFSKGDVITCIVLLVDKIAERVKLTHKKTLLKSKLPVITSYDQLESDCITHGYIASIKPYGVFVNFYNDVHGLVHVSQLSTNFVEDPEKTYFVGQVMKCRVLSCDLSSERVRLSFVLKPKLLEQRKLQQAISQDLVSVEVLRKVDIGLNVLVCNDNKPKKLWSNGFIPIMQLSDFPSLAHAWFEILSPGSVLTDCCVLDGRKQLRLSRKVSITDVFTKSAKEKCDEENSPVALAFSDLKEGLLCNGFVCNIVDYGVFVQLPGGLVGLCPMSKMSDRFLSSSDGYYEEGQSVVAKVVEIDTEKRRFIVSLRVSDCTAGNKQDTILADYIKESTDILTLMNPTWPVNLSAGKRVEVTLTEENKSVKGVPCCSPLFPEIFDAFVVDLENVTGTKKIAATLLYVDFSLKQIVLSSNAKYLLQTKRPKFGRVLSNCHIENVNGDISAVSYAKADDSFVALTLTRTHLNHSTFEKFWPWKLHDSIDFTMSKPICGTTVVAQAPSSNMSFMHKTKRGRQDSESSDISLQGDVNFGNLQVGQEVEGTVKSIRKNCLLVRFTESELEGGYRGNPVVGRLHISEMGNDIPQGVFSMKKYHIGENIKCKVAGFRDVKTHHFLAITNRNARRCVPELTLRDSPLDLQLEHAEVGQKVDAFLTEYVAAKDELHAELTPSLKAFLPVLLLSDNPSKSLKSVNNCKRPAVWHCLVHDIFRHSVGLAGRGAMIDQNTGQDITELKIDCVTNGRIRKIYLSNVVVSLPKGGVGKVHITDSSDDFSTKVLESWEVGQIIRCAILSCTDRKSLVLSTRPSHILSIDEKSDIDIKDREIFEAKELIPGTIIRGFVKNISKSGVFVALSRILTGRVDLTKASKYYIHDIEVVQEIFSEGRLVTCMIVNVSHMEGKVSLSMLESDTGAPDIIPEKLCLPLRHGKPAETKKNNVGLLVDKVEGRRNKKRRLEKKAKGDDLSKTKKKRENDDRDSGLDEEISMVEAPPRYLKIVSDEGDVKMDDPGFSWEVSGVDASTKNASESDDSSDDDDDDGSEQKVKDIPPKKSKKEVELEKTLEEVELRRKEDELLQDNMPQTALDWDKLVLASPQNSMLWVSFMAFHLRATEVEKARAVAERAIKTIDFREEKEKWNVWGALLNLENRFGSKNSLSQTIERASQHNDPLTVNFHMVSTFEKSDKHDCAEELCGKMVRKFKRNKTVWMLYINHLMQKGEGERASEIFKRCLQSLDKNCHLEVITKFAQLEYKIGDSEKGRVLFENALSNYPKRADIWSIYIDMLVKVGKMDEAREIFEKVTTLNLSTKNMRTFFKRYIEFETKYGSDDSVSEIKQKALDYIESKTNDLME